MNKTDLAYYVLAGLLIGIIGYHLIDGYRKREAMGCYQMPSAMTEEQSINCKK